MKPPAPARFHPSKGLHRREETPTSGTRSTTAETADPYSPTPFYFSNEISHTGAWLLHHVTSTRRRPRPTNNVDRRPNRTPINCRCSSAAASLRPIEEFVKRGGTSTASTLGVTYRHVLVTMFSCCTKKTTAVSPPHSSTPPPPPAAPAPQQADSSSAPPPQRPAPTSASSAPPQRRAPRHNGDSFFRNSQYYDGDGTRPHYPHYTPSYFSDENHAGSCSMM
ncbi:hypothetical protein GUJ93_ZPchr0012g19848 [Zizania palustris]|uniref:Uncharacterized protein n=1 Tax=Zizania palustris TaxID=103762 RepID=A0A8J5WHS3_ZIZPA|nr:hypothetical protein GUJ93_ZPchr0012g19848 [Zizania palustris]